MADTKTPELADIPVHPMTGPAGIIPHPRPKPAEDPDLLRGPLGDTTAEPYENEA